jgi:hypothetical protein
MDKHWMSNLPANISKAAFIDLREAFIPSNTPNNSYLELSIRIADEDLAVRDLAAFLDFIDGIYGRLAERGFQSYARREHGHLKVERIQRGSWELLLREVITSSYSQALIIILLAVKYLPPAINSLASSFNQVEQGRLARQNRKRIRAEMEQDETISRLPKDRRRQLAELIEYLHKQEKDRLHRAIRFAQRRLLDIKVRIRSKDE